MRKLTTLLLILVICISLPSFAQQTTIKGNVGDTSEKKELVNAVISVLRKSDSVLVSFTRSKNKGEFTIGNLQKGDYIIMISYPKFADYVESLPIKDDKEIDLGKINLIRKSDLLKEVVVSQKMGAIRIKGDTIEFKADSFATRQGATVEDLLKKLPGIQVNAKGEITAQGEKVQKVLVDGEEFFSDDPAVVTQNLRADALDKVQVFDKKSDQATFTGIDDGEKTKTINLKLKDDKKKGYFGKVKAGGGPDGKYENEAMINYFKGKKKISVFGTMANTGKAGLSWQDNDKYGGNNNVEYNEDEGYFYSFSSGDEFNTWGGQYNGEGLPRAWNGGAHFSNKWNSDKDNVNGNYRYYKQEIEVQGATRTQTILPDTQYFNNESRNTYNQNINHKIDAFYDLQLDSLSSMKLTINGSHTNGHSVSAYTSEALNEVQDPVNASKRNLSSDGTKGAFNSSILWRKKFQKKGRTISINFDEKYDQSETNGFVKSYNDFYNSLGEKFRTDTIDQKKESNAHTISLNSKISYTEPLSKKLFLELNYGFRVTNSEALRNSFNKTTASDPKYELRDSLYSNDYAFLVNTHTAGLSFKVNQEKLVYSLGSNISLSDFNQKDLRTNNIYKYSYTNLFPRANIRYNIAAQRRVSLTYNGNTRQPSLEQLQPIRENTDPLNIQIGNPNLKQSFNHTINLSYNDYKVLTSRNIYVSTYFNIIDNAIGSSSNVDSVGRRTNQYINVQGNYNANLWGGYWFKLKKLNVNIGLNFGGQLSRYNSFVNGQKNVSDNHSVNVGFSVNYDKENKYSFYFNPRATRNYSVSSLNKSIVTQYWTSESEMGGNVVLPWKMEFTTDVNINIRQKTSVFDRNLNNIKWNAYLGKKFWKNKTGELKLCVLDLLDQNIGFERNASSNFISENTYNTVRRVWLLTFTYNFTKNPAVK